jgi:ABC-type arginine transport system permease subunit
MLAAVIVVYGIIGGLGQLVDVGPAWLEFLTRSAFLSAVVLLGLVAARWASEAWRGHMVDARRDDLEAAMRRLRLLDGGDGIGLDDLSRED